MTTNASRAIADQTAFRAIMNAMAHPGRVEPLQGLATPAPLSQGAAAVLRALADADTAVWLDAPLAQSAEVSDWIAFHCGASLTQDRAKAAFAVLSDPASCPPFDGFSQAEADFPDRSTTLILQVAEFRAGRFTLTGPGIEREQRFGATPLPDDFGHRLARNHALFPRGLDFLFVGPGGVAAVPRSSRIEER